MTSGYTVGYLKMNSIQNRCESTKTAESANDSSKGNRNTRPQLDCVLDCLCCEAIKGSNIYRVILKATGSKEQILFCMAIKCL